MFRTYLESFMRSGSPSAKDLPSWSDEGWMRFTNKTTSLESDNFLNSRCEFWSDAGFALSTDVDALFEAFPFTSTIPFLILLAFFLAIMTWQLALFIRGYRLNKRLGKIHQVLGDESLKFPGVDDILDLEAESTAMMAIPEPKILKCENVSFMVKDKLLISGISVECMPGSLTAIMGPSGMIFKSSNYIRL